MKTTQRIRRKLLLFSFGLIAACTPKTPGLATLNAKHPEKLVFDRSETTQALSVTLTEMRVYTSEPSPLDESGRRVVSLLFVGIQGAEVAGVFLSVESRGKDYST